MRMVLNALVGVLFLYATSIFAQGDDLIFEDSFELCLDPATIKWDGGGDGTKWSDPLNWEGDAVPGNGASVVILEAGTVLFDSSATDVSLDCFGSISHIDLAARTLTIERIGSFTAGLMVRGSGILNVAGRAFVQDEFVQSGGTVGGFGTLVANGSFAWSGGTMRDSGATTINGASSFAGSTIRYLRERTVTLNGETTWTGGNLYFGYSSVLNIEAPFNIQGDQDIVTWSTVGTININAALTKAAGAGTTILAANFFNNDSVTVSTGNLDMGRSGASGTSSGNFEVTSALSTLTVRGAHSLAGGNMTGAGNFLLDGGSTAQVTQITGTFSMTGELTVKTGTLVFPGAQTFPSDITVAGGVLDLRGAVTANKNVTINNGTLTVANSLGIDGNLTQTAGILRGVGSIAVTGAFGWGGGTLQDSGTTTFNGAVSMTGSTIRYLRERTVTLNGETTWTGGNLYFGYSSVLNIEAPFNIQGDQDIVTWSTVGTININAALTKAAGAGTTILAANFFNNDSVTVSTGNLDMGRSGASGTSSGNFKVTSAFSTLTVRGAHSLVGGNMTGAGNFLLDGGSTAQVTQITGTFSMTGELTVKTGTLVFPGAQTFPSDITVAGGVLDLRGAVTVNKNVTINNGTLTVADSLDIDGNLTQTAGILRGVGSIAVTGAFGWGGGTLQDSGTTTFNGAVSMTGSTIRYLRERTVTLNGETTWTGGNLYFGYSSVLNIEAPFNIQGDQDIVTWSTVGTININAALTKAAGAGTTILAANFFNNDSVTVSTGNLDMGRSGASGTSSGNFEVTSALSTLTVRGAHSLAGGNMTGAGNFLLDGGSTAQVTQITGTFSMTGELTVKTGTLVFPGAQAFPSDITVAGGVLDLRGAVTANKNVTINNGTLTVANSLGIDGNLTQTAGILRGVGSIAVTGAFGWGGGTLQDSGTTTFNGAVSMTGSTIRYLRERTVTLNGETTWTGGNLYFGYSSVLNIEAPFNIQGDQDIVTWSTVGTININAALTKAAGAGTTALGANLINNASISVATGELTFTRIFAQGGSGTLNVNVSSLAVFDVFAVTQQVTLDGTLQVNLIGGYTPASADSFQIMTFANNGLTGTFATVNVVPSGSFNVNYNTNNVTLVVP